jgi:acetoin utilization protein AcuB
MISNHFEKISQFMTPMSFTVTQEMPLREAADWMETYHLRYLPIERWGNIVGVLAYPEARHALLFHSGRLLRVLDIMMKQPLVVSPDSDLARVVFEMSESKQDCAVVCQGSQVVGVFTPIEALRVLLEKDHYKSFSKVA